MRRCPIFFGRCPFHAPKVLETMVMKGSALEQSAAQAAAALVGSRALEAALSRIDHDGFLLVPIDRIVAVDRSKHDTVVIDAHPGSLRRTTASLEADAVSTAAVVP